MSFLSPLQLASASYFLTVSRRDNEGDCAPLKTYILKSSYTTFEEGGSPALSIVYLTSLAHVGAVDEWD